MAANVKLVAFYPYAQMYQNSWAVCKRHNPLKTAGTSISNTIIGMPNTYNMWNNYLYISPYSKIYSSIV